MAAEEASPVRKKKRERSPSHPGIGLEAALARARQLYEKEGRHAAPIDVILGDWGYQPKSGAGLVAIAALKQFGLLFDEGSGSSRRAKLSDEALRILLDERDSEERHSLIQEAALRPRIHRELWDEYQGSLPSDATLRSKLRLERRFTESAIADFIPQFRDTLAVAGLIDSDTMPHQDEDGPARGGRMEGVGLKERERPSVPGTQTLRAPLAPGRAVVVQMPERMTDKEWALLEANLAAWKLATVQEQDQDE